MRIVTFNIESLDDRPGLDPSLDQRIAVLRPQLLRIDADVICLQEVNGQHPAGGGPRRLLALDHLLETTRYADYHRVSSESEAGDGVADVHNLVILSRWPIVDREQLRHDLVPLPLYHPVTAIPAVPAAGPVEWDRPILMATIALPDRRSLHVVNLHLRAPLAAPIAGQKVDALTWRSAGGWAEGFFLAAVKRAGQALEVRLLVERLFDDEPEALIAICGDFNAERREAPLRTVLADVEDTGNDRLAMRSLVALEGRLPLARRFSVRHHGREAMLDHILVSHPLLAHCRHVEVHNETLGDEWLERAALRHSAGSFHAPVLADFALPVLPEAPS